jgi:glutamate dehydrogenase (NAD(P)+)
MANLFKMAVAQLDEAAGLLGLDSATHELLRRPRREFHFTLSARMDDGSHAVFPGFRVQYNDSRGPACGGIRFHPNETTDKARARAAWITWKAALMGLPLSGAFGGVACNAERLSARELENVTRAYIRAISFFTDQNIDVITSDIYDPPEVEVWMSDERSALDNRTPTRPFSIRSNKADDSVLSEDVPAKGGIFCVREAAKYLGMELKEARTAVHGFDAYGAATARLSVEHFGLRVIGVSDGESGIFNPKGLDVGNLVEHKRRTGTIVDFPGADNVPVEKLIETECEVLWVTDGEPAINAENAERINARIIAEAADGAATPEADIILHNRGVFVIPDIICNVGGLILSYFNLVRGSNGNHRTLEMVTMRLDDRITKAFHKVLEERNARNIHMRLASYLIAIGQVVDAMKRRGWC